MVNFIGIIYPAFKSLEALESDELGDDKQWLTYWVCFSFFIIIDKFADRLFIKRLIPFYFFMKITFLIYLFHPKTLGAKNIYQNVILPLVQGNEAKIEQFASDALSKIQEFAFGNYTTASSNGLNDGDN